MKIDCADPSFKIEQFNGGPWGENSYILYHPQSHHAVLIDPGWGAGKLKRFLSSHSLKLDFILNTHGHIDHIGENHSFDVPIYVHKDDARFLSDPLFNLSGFTLWPYRSPEPARLLNDGDEIPFRDGVLRIIHTPGHTPGSIAIGFSDILFTGDTLFCSSIGRTDFPYGDGGKIIQSIRTKLIALEDDVKILPGHGPISTIGAERHHNPFLNQ